MNGLAPNEIFVDLFAGGGGTSSGAGDALGRPVDIAVNHDEAAIAMHRRNHPQTRHYREDVWAVDPREACGSNPVGGLWLSPDCTHFSKAKGSQPRKKEIRSLADVGIRWAEQVRPRWIFLENVEEFEDWGPLDDAGKVIAGRKGEFFKAWCGRLSDLGYQLEYRTLVAADYGAPTTRSRLFLLATRDGGPIVWPTPTHGKGRPSRWRAAAEIIDWSLPCHSIFRRKKPLAEATLRRIAEGIRRFVVRAHEPFIVRHGHYSTITGAGLREGCGAGTFRGQRLVEPLATVCATNDKNLIVPLVTKHYGGGENGKPPPGLDAREPLGTITVQDHHALTAAFLTKFYGTSTGSPVTMPVPTVTAGGGHIGEVRAFLKKYTNKRVEAGRQMIIGETVDDGGSNEGVLTIEGQKYQIVDIGMRMLSPAELFAAQGFPRDYDITPEVNGKPITKTQQISLAGNSVPPPMAKHVVSAAIYGRDMLQ